MNKSFLATCLISTLTLCAAPCFASSADDWGVNLKAGTLGAGVELSKSLSDKFSVSLGFNSYNYKTTDNTNGIDYDFKYELQSMGLLGNYHPFAGAFRFTGGVLYNNNELKLTGKPSAGSTYTINGVTYTAAQVGTLTGTLTFNKTAPYLGLGWGNRPGSKFGLSADLGVLYQASPKLALTATGASAGLSSDLEQERKKAESDLADFKWYPVLSLGLYFRF
jgi:hypothetical protein